ncbi:Pentatricopeptide repeat-containing protein [Abeliophyllum distichum]|uniref:Pentatricopeptide repeat-containing protein n=1 Tax=Abeliophyllum distichum TaxID=126358 RepID=A0ABD1QVN8_9LAMI
MITLRCARQSRATTTTTTTTRFLLLFSTTATTSIQPYPYYYSNPFFPSSSKPTTSLQRGAGSPSELQLNDVVSCFREWFMSRNNPLLDRIFETLRAHDESAADSALSRFNLHLSEALVLEVLNYEKRDVLSCLKFFDWAGRQPGFYHSRATFNAIFRILSKAKLMSLMLDFLQNYMKQRYVHKVRFYNTLVIGYAVAGKSEVALELFGRMRFQGVDLDAFAYHVLLNSLVEEGYFDVVEMVAKQIKVRAFQNEVTHSIMMKSFCKQNELERAENYLRGLVGDNGMGLSGIAVGIFVDALCKDNQFEKAALLIEEFHKMDLVSMEYAYSVWIRDLVKAGKLDGALEFLKDKQSVEGYVPDVFRYNTLICRLLKENRFEEVCDLLMEMKERGILPDDVTMNATLCFLCKAGMMDVAMDLYDSRAEFGLSVSCMAYNYLINTLVGDGTVDEAYRVLRNSMEQGYFPGKKTFSIISDALCREGKLEKMKELVLVALDQNIMPNDLTYDKFISALCKAKRVEDGYLVHGQLNRLNKVAARSTYVHLISGFNKLSRGDIAARLLIEMQEKGYHPRRKLYRDVICCLCQTDDAEKQVFRLLEMQLARLQPSSRIYNFFIDGAGHARKPELARQVYEMMTRSGLLPDLNSDILMLQSYLKSEKIADALNFFHDAYKRRNRRKLWQTMIVGLCKVNKPEQALQIFENMKANKLPSLESYEELVKLYCDHRQYYKVVELINDMIQIGRPISSFIGNVLLLHSLRTRKLYDAWAYLNHQQNLTPVSLTLGQLIGVFSGCIEVNQDIEDVEKLIQQSFPLDTYTYNMLLRRLSMKEMDCACKYLDRLHQKGYEPNRWTYDIIVHGFAKRGQIVEAKKWMEKMFSKGFDLTENTKKFI